MSDIIFTARQKSHVPSSYSSGRITPQDHSGRNRTRLGTSQSQREYPDPNGWWNYIVHFASCRWWWINSPNTIFPPSIVLLFINPLPYKPMFLQTQSRRLLKTLTHCQTANFRRFQTERVCRQQFQIWWKWQKVIQAGKKHCGKRRNCSLRAISPFPTVFSKGLFPRGVKRRHCAGMS